MTSAEVARRATRKYRDNHPERAKQSFLRSQLKKHGLSIEDYEKMMLAQDGKCAICSRDDYGTRWARRLAVDHCHETGSVRGLLCWNCNTTLGKFKDDPQLFLKAAAYLLGVPVTSLSSSEQS